MLLSGLMQGLRGSQQAVSDEPESSIIIIWGTIDYILWLGGRSLT